jgi:cyclopropane-fatty-acyl-phospholipid synthase
MTLTQLKERPPLLSHPVLDLFRHIKSGALTVDLPGGASVSFGADHVSAPARMRVRHREALDRILRQGSVGMGEGYMLGLWDTDDLPGLLRLMTGNLDAMKAALAGSMVRKAFYVLRNRLRLNTLTGSRRNIHAHYDLGNDFYALWLDETLTYSGALFGGDPSKSLEDAQRAKYRRILGRLSPGPEDHILELGCGWGGFMREAAEHGLHVTGLTISPAQAELARERLARAGLSDLAEVRLQDYRDVREKYDHVVSIGMFEHVGEDFWPRYMNTVRGALKPGGRAVIQSIVVRDDLFDSYRNDSDFIREHIFPGGMLPSRAGFRRAASTAGLRTTDVFLFGGDYAITLEKWLEKFDRNAPAVRALGYDEPFIRKWRFYLAAAAAMFRSGRINLIQATLEAREEYPFG